MKKHVYDKKIRRNSVFPVSLLTDCCNKYLM